MITKSVSLIAPPGVYAGISVFAGDGIDINAGATDTVTLRGMTVNNQGTSGGGILFTTGATLHIENCTVNGFSDSFGVFFNGAGNLEINDSIMRDDKTGILVQALGAVATIDCVRLEENSHGGLIAAQGSKVTVRNSIASGNGIGFEGLTTSGPGELNIENCVASNNNSGIVSQTFGFGVATVRVSNSTVTDNVVGLLSGGAPAVLLSRGNNTVEGNGTNTQGTIGSYAAK